MDYPRALDSSPEDRGLGIGSGYEVIRMRFHLASEQFSGKE